MRRVIGIALAAAALQRRLQGHGDDHRRPALRRELVEKVDAVLAETLT